MLHASTQQLIRKLCELTDAGAIDWKEGKGQISLLETEGYVVEIQPEPPSVRLLRNDGQELESADAADLATPWGENEGTFADNVANMARRANRYARGAETAIAKILSSLSAPPKKQAAPEPEPAALTFAAVPKPALILQASESAAAIAALNADLESQRRKAAEPPPASHSVAAAATPAISPETETAIDRVLAVQPPVVIEKPKEEPKPQPEPVAVALTAPAPAQPAVVAPRPAPVLPPPVQAITPTPSPVQTTPPAPAAPVAKAGFGAIDSFARAQPSTPTPTPPTPQPAPKPQPAVQAASGLLMRGFSVQSRQTVEPSTAKDFYRPAMGAIPAAPPPQQAAPAKPELKPEPVKATGKDVYKPWG
ncbi:MAG TPA: hypothetical protein PLN33_15590 [Hyphomonadaceae bacterium]|nr:hypothetical protein [Hyphomonadaceae bacterium]HPN06198.1 hypothetical protein [Hyphomonadaceae bacterium]